MNDPQPVDTQIRQWVSPVPPMRWPTNLESRLAAIREAVQALDHDLAISMLFDLERDAHIIQRDHERIALRTTEHDPRRQRFTC